MNAASTKQLFAALASRFELEKERLGELDAVLGDGDHGASMAKGFGQAHDAVKAADSKDIGVLLQTAGRALMTGIGGASGPLFGMVLLELAKPSSGETELSADAFKTGIAGATNAVQRLGKAEPGDKTMLDVLFPVNDAIEATGTLDESLKCAAMTAHEAATKTAKLMAKKGRAQYVQGGGLGHPDPGATSLALLFDTLYQNYLETSA